MKLISLTRGLFTQVDDEDFDYLSEWKWYAVPNHGKSFYAVRKSRLNERPVGAPRNGIFMHHVICGIPTNGMKIDHRDRDGLNNQRLNLRVCTDSQNDMNKALIKSSSSGFKGASFHKRIGRWKSQIGINGTLLHLGYFESLEEAAKAYDAAASKHFGEFANLNFPVSM